MNPLTLLKGYHEQQQLRKKTMKSKIAIIVLCLSMPLNALEPAIKTLDNSMRLLFHATRETSQMVAFPYIYLIGTISLSDNGDTIIVYKMPGGSMIGRRPYPVSGQRYLVEMRTNKPPDELFTKIMYIYSDGKRKIIAVER